MNICFINLPFEYYSPKSGGAIATAINKTGRYLIEFGHTMTVLTPVNGDELYDVGDVIPVASRRRDDLSFVQRRWSDVRRLVVGYDWPYYEFYLASVVQTLEGLRPVPDAVVMFNDFYLADTVRRIFPDAKIAVWLHNECRTRPSNRRNTLKAADVFIACSQYIADWTAQTHGISADRIFVATNGVDHSMFSPRGNFLDTRRIPKALVLGRLDPNKGTDLVVAAVSALKTEGIELSLTVAGAKWFYPRRDPRLDSYFNSLMDAIDQSDATALGHVPRDRVPALVADHDIVCVLSRSNEPFGLVALEAMAGGCAVLASNRGGLPDACDGAGVLVNPDDLSAVIAALRKLVTDPAHLTEQKRRSVARAARAGWDLTAHAVEETLENNRTPVQCA